jgi:hypothetical protein
MSSVEICALLRIAPLIHVLLPYLEYDPGKAPSLFAPTAAASPTRLSIKTVTVRPFSAHRANSDERKPIGSIW